MPDITMCLNENCLSRKNCYRFMAIPDDYQSYSLFENSFNKDKCKYFWKINSLDKIQR